MYSNTEIGKDLEVFILLRNNQIPNIMYPTIKGLGSKRYYFIYSLSNNGRIKFMDKIKGIEVVNPNYKADSISDINFLFDYVGLNKNNVGLARYIGNILDWYTNELNNRLQKNGIIKVSTTNTQQTKINLPISITSLWMSSSKDGDASSSGNNGCNVYPPQEPKCTCGAEKCGGAHYEWCDKYEEKG